MKKIACLIIFIFVSSGMFSQTQEELLRTTHWRVTKLTLDNEDYIRPVNSEINVITTNFTCTYNNVSYSHICYSYWFDEIEINENNSIAFFSSGTFAIPQECDLEENNIFDILYYNFFAYKDTVEPWDPFIFQYEVTEEETIHYLVLTNGNGDKAYFNNTSASQKLFNSINVKIYPNPTSSFVNISLPNSDHQNVVVNIYDISGRKVKSYKEKYQENINIDLHELVSGNYFLELNIPNNKGRGYVTKFIKE